MSRRQKAKKNKQKQAARNKPRETAVSDSPTSAHIDGGGVEAAFPPQLAKEHTTGKQESREQKKFWIEVATLVVVAAYTSITFWQACSTSQAVSDSSEHFVLDERPWITITYDTAPIGINSPVVSRFHIVNTGKTAAKNLSVDANIEIVSAKEAPTFNKRGVNVVVQNIMLPNSPSDANIGRRQRTDSRRDEPVVLSEAEYNSLRQGDSYMATYADVTYSDLFGISHWQRFCGWNAYFAGQASAQGVPMLDKYFNSFTCVSYNDADNNRRQ